MTASQEALQKLQQFEKEHPDIVRIAKLIAEHDELLDNWIKTMVRSTLADIVQGEEVGSGR